MTKHPFAHSFDELPATLPVFPLPGALLLPHGKLPLNIFEPRYLNMCADALKADRLIGMIQPRENSLGGATSDLYETGCAGRITAFNETDDGRLLITLTGIIRFSVRDEVQTTRGYRRVVPEWNGFAGDLHLDENENGGIDRDRLLAAVRAYFDNNGMTANWDVIEEAPAERLVTSLAMICPFETQEKQALLECGSLADRANVMITLMEMSAHDGSADNPIRH